MKFHESRLSNLTQNTGERSNDEGNEDLGIYSIYATHCQVSRSDKPRPKNYMVTVKIDSKPVVMHIDTAADFSIIGKDVFEHHFPTHKLQRSDVSLKTYTGEILQIEGQFMCSVEYEGQYFENLPVIVAKYCGKPSLLGKNWLCKLQLDWKSIFFVDMCTKDVNRELEALLNKYRVLFTEGYEGIKGFEGTIHVRDNAKPVYCKPRSVPYALKGEVERELAKLEENGVIKKVSKSSWAAPVVIVPKSDKTV